jgi:EmrB/QacA subfamily drug resistance transporter
MQPSPSFLSTRRGRLTLGLVCLAGFLDFIDTTIVNVALPSIRHGLGFSVANLQWVISGYLLTYGGLMLLGGRASDLLGRRRPLITGTALFAVSSLAAGLADNDSVMIAARLAQGLGAAMMTPAALSILTTSFPDGTDRIKALGVWSATVPLASALGVTLGGILSQGPGWRAVFLVNVPLAGVVVIGALRLLDDDRKTARGRELDLPGAALGTGGLLVLVYALVNASHIGWGTTRTVAELAAAVVLLVAFVVAEQRQHHPLVPFSIFRIEGLAAADATQVIAQAGFLSMFFFITLYMQNVLGYSPIAAGTAYLPVTVGVGIAAGISTRLVERIGTRPIILTGALIGAAGVYWLSRIPVHGSYLTDLLPGLVILALGLGAVMVGVQNAANAGVPADKAGLAAALITTSSTIGAALGLAILTAIATSRTDHLIDAHASTPVALTGGFREALIACTAFLVAAAVIAARATNTHASDATSTPPALIPDPA